MKKKKRRRKKQDDVQSPELSLWQGKKVYQTQAEREKLIVCLLFFIFYVLKVFFKKYKFIHLFQILGVVTRHFHMITYVWERERERERACVHACFHVLIQWTATFGDARSIVRTYSIYVVSGQWSFCHVISLLWPSHPSPCLHHISLLKHNKKSWHLGWLDLRAVGVLI